MYPVGFGKKRIPDGHFRDYLNNERGRSESDNRFQAFAPWCRSARGKQAVQYARLPALEVRRQAASPEPEKNQLEHNMMAEETHLFHGRP